MFRRMCLFLLMIGLALPATAAPMHCVSPMQMAVSQAHAHHGKSDAPVAPMSQHDCIGCIAPYSTLAQQVTAELIVAAPHKPLGDFLLARLSSGPDTPPPRA